MRTDINNKLPPIIESMIKSLNNTKDNHLIRANYRLQLDLIRAEIDKAIKIYDNETPFRRN